ncbi:hypothetical protein [Bosea sp. BH3]|uniref:hypothetical protein n=1 Tax=Bosea sp. BH3 TaxID=2871701 RepID=UPI0021CB5711|nr:hypothetical protein [Bosea sp. BH3]MCU4179157.1 hypothetical protein [Bosea sp. BH3]
MATSLPWSVKGVDPRTRDAAKAAARRAGMTLGEWLDNKIRVESQDSAKPPAPADGTPEQLDIAALSDRLARLLSQGLAETAPRQAQPGPHVRDTDAFTTQTANIERLTQEANSQTAGALDSITRWIEKTEERLSSSERGTAERQERATGVIAEAIKSMGERIAEIERRSAETRPERAEPSGRPAFNREGLGAAVTDIRTRQRVLDNDEAAAPHRTAVAPERISALREDLRELGSRFSFAGRGARPAEAGGLETKIAALSERLDGFDRHERIESLLKPLARIESEVTRLAQERTGAGDRRIQSEIAHLSAKVDALTARGSDPALIAPIMRDIAELRDLVAAGGQLGKLDELAQQVASLGYEVVRLREDQPDPRELRNISAAIEDVRGAVLSGRGPELGAGALASLAQQIEMLSHRFDEAAAHQPGARIEDRIDALQQRIEILAERGPAPVVRQIETLAGRIESLAASSQLGRMVGGGENGSPVDTGPIEQMLRRLADKIDEAGAPGARPESFEALEHQIAGIAARLDEAAATRSAETGIERTLQDLVTHLRSMREENAAERASFAQTAGTAAPVTGTGMAELSDLVADLRDTHVSTERQTQHALGAVHTSLETIMSRLASLEAELQGGEHRPAAPRESVNLPVSALAEDRFGAPAFAAAPTAAPSRAEQPVPALADTAFDLPLEPGSGRPRAEAPVAGGQDLQSVRQSLIAAARRSAKAASEAAATAPSDAAQTAPKSSRKIKDLLARRKRPLLLSLAALLLALGTAHIVTGALRKDETRTASGEARSLIARPAAQAEAPMEPAAQSTQLAQPAKQAAAQDSFPAADQTSALSPSPLATPMGLAPGSALPGQITASLPPAAAEPQATVAPPAAPEAVQAVTGVGDLPASLGSNGLRKAALDGDARAVYELASRAADGPATQRDPKLALRLFERAAVAGLAPAQFRVGNMFEKGIGTQRDLALARIWYQRAAERGNAKAMHNLAVLHAEGVTGKPDYAVATEWFQRAAELGVRDSQYNLAVLLGRGLGAPTDLSQSFLWFAVAAGQGDEDAARKRDEVGQRLKAEELATVRTQANNWKPKTLDAVANEVTAPPKGWDPAPTAAAAKPTKPARI